MTALGRRSLPQTKAGTTPSLLEAALHQGWSSRCCVLLSSFIVTASDSQVYLVHLLSRYLGEMLCGALSRAWHAGVSDHIPRALGGARAGWVLLPEQKLWLVD